MCGCVDFAACLAAAARCAAVPLPAHNAAATAAALLRPSQRTPPPAHARAGGTLHDFLLGPGAAGRPPLTPAEARWLFHQFVVGLDFIHR